VIRENIARLSDVEKMALSMWWAIDGPFELGSVCSGTDCPVLVLQEIQKVCKDVLGPSIDELQRHNIITVHEATALKRGGNKLDMKHAFSCDIAPEVREFQRTMFPDLPVLFKDVRDLKAGAAINVTKGDDQTEKVDVPTFSVLTGGFPCQDVSIRNKYHPKNKAIIKSRTGRTASAFGGITDLLKERSKPGARVRKPCNLIFLEQVRGIASPPTTEEQDEDGNTIKKKWTIHESNLSTCLLEMKECGYFCVPTLQDPRNYGTPQSRARFWIPGIRMGMMEDIKMIPTDAHRWIGELLRRFGGHGMTPGSKLLLAEDHPLIMEMVLAAKDRSFPWEASAQEKEKVSQCKWKKKHAQEFAAKIHSLPVMTQAQLDEAKKLPGFRAMVKRQMDVYVLATGSETFPATKECRFIDISQSIGRARECMTPEVLACASPRQEVWISDRSRFLHGLESLAFQGIHYQDRHHEAGGNFSSDALAKLAGNAFHSGCMAATVLATMIAVGVALLQSRGMQFVAGSADGAISLAAPLLQRSDTDLDAFWDQEQSQF